ncbi:unnamed protein product [Allacma fusca]|uniref:Uncharacterized protein n=1 Tax=Allacma fusca TaxID=39272 RepID=A0A8J2JFB7_9HEXA|nr:unnamed protein product [Allacma fusca]
MHGLSKRSASAWCNNLSSSIVRQSDPPDLYGGTSQRYKSAGAVEGKVDLARLAWTHEVLGMPIMDKIGLHKEERQKGTKPLNEWVQVCRKQLVQSFIATELMVKTKLSA